MYKTCTKQFRCPAHFIVDTDQSCLKLCVKTPDTRNPYPNKEVLAPLTFEFSKLRANHSTLPVELPILFVDEVGRASASSPEPLLVGSPRRVADSLLGSRVGADAANMNDD